MGKPFSRCQARLYIRTCVVLGFGLFAAPAGVAAQSAAAFTAHYEHLAQVESELLARTQALSPDQSARGATIAQAVAQLNTYITALYTVDQALSAVGAHPLPPARVQQDIAPALRQARVDLTVEVRASTQAPGRSPAVRERLQTLVLAARAAGRQITGELAALSAGVRRPVFRRSAVLQNDVMQSAIIRLQTTAISLTDAWLLLADTTWAGSWPVSVVGLAYTSATIVAPARGQAPVTDTVGVQPTVTDASGHVLPDTGIYHLKGPPRRRGVSVDRLIGTVTVRRGATPGQYTITYTQGQAKEQVILRVTP